MYAFDMHCFNKNWSLYLFWHGQDEEQSGADDEDEAEDDETDAVDDCSCDHPLVQHSLIPVRFVA